MIGRSGGLAFGVLALLVIALPGVATGQEEPSIRIQEVVLDPDGATALDVSVLGADDVALTDDAFLVTERGERIGEVSVEPFSELAEQDPLTVVLVFDISGSTAGEPLDAAKAAAEALATDLVGEGAAVALVPFERTVGEAVPPTTDLAELRTAIAGLTSGSGTSLHDAIVRAADVVASADGDRRAVVFTDGADTSSSASADQAIAAAAGAALPITMVALDTPDQDLGALTSIADRTNGEVLTAASTDQLGSAFERAAESITNRYRLSYRGTALAPELDLAVTVSLPDGGEDTATATVRNQRVASADLLPDPPAASLFSSGAFGEPWVLWAAAATAFAGLALFLGLLLVPRSDREATRTLRRGLGTLSRGGSAQPTSGLSASALGQRAIELVEAVPKPQGYEDRLQNRLDRGGWQIRASEFTALRAGVALGCFALVGALTGSMLLGLLAGVGGAFIPSIILSSRTQKRQTAFRDQLPDTLQLLSGTLKAGYGTLQGIDTIVKETRPPMSTEFQRVLTESRLGLPLEESLDDMAARVGDEDFRWVVVAMNIQRQVGGNLASLLETVSETLRQRETTRRQIKVLSAEGRLSAGVLLALPFLLIGYMLFVNPVYILTLFDTVFGLTMVIGSLGLMVVGFLWMKKLIRIDV